MSQVRDSIAERSKRYEQRYPRALDLEAHAVVAAHAVLSGHAEALRGVLSGDDFREMWRGEAPVSLRELCRLATSEHPRARDAAESVLDVLAAALGLALVPKVLRFSDQHKTAARLAVVPPQAVAALIEFLQDGKLTRDERLALAPHADSLRVLLAELDGLASGGES